MISKTLYTNDSGASISATFTHSDATPVDLADATVTFLMRSIGQVPAIAIANPATIVDSDLGQVRYGFAGEDLAVAGDYEIAWEVHYGSDTLTYPTGGPQTLRILESMDEAPDSDSLFAYLVTPPEAFNLTASRVTEADILRAQTLIEIFLNRDLQDTDWLASITARDLRKLKTAVAFQATHAPETPSGLTALTGVKSISEGDISITYNDNRGSFEESLTAIVMQTLKGLSWRSSNTIRPKPMVFGNSNRTFDPWI